MAEIRLKVVTGGAPFTFDAGIAKEAQEKFGDAVKITPGPYEITEALGRARIGKEAFVVQVAWFLLALGASVPLNLFSSWLYDRLKEHHVTASIDGQPIQDKETLEKMLRTILERQLE